MKIMLIFSGQGYSETTIFNLFKTDKTALDYLQSLSNAAGIDLIKQAKAITLPHMTQYIISAYQLTLFSIIAPLLMNHSVEFAGYSLGEVSAFLASVKADPAEAMRVIRSRTELMLSILNTSKQPEFDLLSIKGTFTFETIQSLCKKYRCAIAIINADNHYILGGMIVDLKKLLTELSQQPVKQTTFLSIHLPSHTSFYAQKANQLREMLDSTFSHSTLSHPIISPLKLKKIVDASEEMQLLDNELYTMLNWQSVCNLIAEYGYDVIIDLGPGGAMTSILTAAIANFPTIPIITLANFNSTEGIKNHLKSLMNS